MNKLIILLVVLSCRAAYGIKRSTELSLYNDSIRVCTGTPEHRFAEEAEALIGKIGKIRNLKDESVMHLKIIVRLNFTYTL